MKDTKKTKITRGWLKILTGSTFFTVRFIKADGSERLMNCRMGAAKFASPTAKRTEAMRTADERHNHLTVTDLQKDLPRKINCNTVLEIKARGLHLIRENLNETFKEF